MKQIKIYNDYNSKFLFNSAKIKSLILNVFEEKQIKLIELSIIIRIKLRFYLINISRQATGF